MTAATRSGVHERVLSRLPAGMAFIAAGEHAGTASFIRQLADLPQRVALAGIDQFPHRR